MKRELLTLSEDLFYSPSNIGYLEKVTAEIDSGTAKLSEHELIEEFITNEFAHSADWDNIPETAPDEFDLHMLEEIEHDKECHEFIPADEAEKILGLS